MRKDACLLAVAASLIFLAGCSSSKYFIVKDFEEKYRPNIKTIAFLPVESSIDSISMKKCGIDSIKIETAKVELRLQIFERMSKDEARYSTSFQDAIETDKLLYEADIKTPHIDSTNIGDLKKILGCDGILTCTISEFKLKADEGAQIGMMFGLVGALAASGGGGHPRGYATYSLWDGDSGGLVWQRTIKTTKPNWDQSMDKVIGLMASNFLARWPFGDKK